MKDIEMSRRNKWIIIVVIIGFLSCGTAAVVYDLGYGAIRIFHERRRMESRRPVLLYQTDHLVPKQASYVTVHGV